MSSDRFNRLSAFAIAVITAIAAIIGYLQNDAGAKDDRANRDSKRYSVQALGRQVSGQARVNFDYYGVYQSFSEFELQDGEGEDKVYGEMAEAIRKLSPLLNGVYYDAKAREADVARYEADTYLVETTQLSQMFKAAAVVKDGWDYKSNTYIVHLTLLAVALFLWGLAATIAGPSTRGLFAVAGTIVALWATVWAGMLWARPVYDMRTAGTAIQDYAQAFGLEHRADDATKGASALRQEALKKLDSALGAAPEYQDALLLRAQIRTEEGQSEPAAQDLQKVLALDPNNAEAHALLAGVYYDLGKFDQALASIQAARLLKSDEAWFILDTALIQLAAGQEEPAKASVKEAIDMVAARIAEAAQKKEEPPSDLLEALSDAAADFEELGEKKKVKAGEEIAAQLASAEMALEYTGKLPGPKPAAKIGELTFTETSDDGKQDKPAAEEFGDHVTQISTHFEYSGMKDGQSVIFRTYRDGVEDTSWRVIEDWEGGPEGEYEQILSPGYTDTFTFEPGEYLVEVYVDYHFAGAGSFKVGQGD